MAAEGPKIRVASLTEDLAVHKVPLIQKWTKNSINIIDVILSPPLSFSSIHKVSKCYIKIAG